MLRSLVPASAMLAVLATAGVAAAAVDSEYVCQSGSTIRRISIEVEDGSRSVPCSVVYSKETEAPGDRRTLWSAKADRAYCEAKAKGLADKLSSGGWQCSQAGGQPPTPVDASPPSAPEPLAPAAPPPDGQPALAGPEPSAAPPATATPGPAAAGNQANLDQVIQQNLQSLNQSVDGSFKAEVAKFGDLNRDGLTDAVVLFDYQSSGAELTQFVAAYLFNGQTYHLAATKPVGGSDRSIRGVAVENIVDGSIRLRLDGAAEGASRSAGMVLQDGQLVEVN